MVSIWLCKVLTLLGSNIWTTRNECMWDCISSVKRPMLFSHLCQNVFRKVKENRFQLYDDLNNPFRIHVKMVLFACFLASTWCWARVFDLWCLQFGGLGTDEQVILGYFERTYVGEVRGGVRGHPYSNIHCGMYMIASINELTPYNKRSWGMA